MYHSATLASPALLPGLNCEGKIRLVYACQIIQGSCGTKFQCWQGDPLSSWTQLRAGVAQGGHRSNRQTGVCAHAEENNGSVDLILLLFKLL